MPKFRLFVNEIEDPYVKENFERLTRFVNDQSFLRGEWQFFEITFTGAVTNYKHKHNLGFVPKDILQTSKTGAGAITFNYTSFDSTNIDITTTGACVVRFFVGSYRDETR